MLLLLLLLLLCQLDELITGVRAVSESDVAAVAGRWKNETSGGAMSAADLSASVEVMLRLTMLYRARRHSLVLPSSVMHVSITYLTSTPRY